MALKTQCIVHRTYSPLNSTCTHSCHSLRSSLPIKLKLLFCSSEQTWNANEGLEEGWGLSAHDSMVASRKRTTLCKDRRQAKKLLSLTTCFDEGTIFNILVALLCLFLTEFFLKKKRQVGKDLTRLWFGSKKGCWGNPTTYSACLIERFLLKKKRSCCTLIGVFPWGLWKKPWQMKCKLTWETQ